MFQIKSLSKPVLESLYELKGAYTHSVFNNVLNLKWENKLISIQNTRVPKGTLSMIVDGEVNFKEHMDSFTGKLDINDSIVAIGKMKFLIDKPEIWDPQLKHIFKIPCISKKVFIKEIKNIILINGKDSGIKDATLQSMKSNVSQNYIEQNDLFYKILFETTKSLSKKELNVAANKISNLVGIGIGLTPAGDDFLVGLISVLYSMKQEKDSIKNLYFLLCKEIIKNANKTTDVSKNYLLEAVEGRFSESFHNIYEALEKENLQELYKSALSMMAVGHSSGTDGLCGILWGFYQLECLN